MNNLYKGRIAEHIVAQEMIVSSDNYLQPLLFWVREKNNSNAEVDFKSPLAIRLYAGEYRREELETPNGHKFTLLNLPYCFAGKLQEYVKAWMEER